VIALKNMRVFDEEQSRVWAGGIFFSPGFSTDALKPTRTRKTDMTDLQAPPLIDVRTISPQYRHSAIFGVLKTLEPGKAMHVTSDHDPRPLHMQIQSRYPDDFDWAYLESGPEVWRVEIKRLDSSCCGGGCGN
jgi:uncharacterized protein (DUF2249 family)